MAGKYKEMSKIKQVILVAAVPIQRQVGLQEKEREPLYYRKRPSSMLSCDAPERLISSSF